MAFGRHLHPLIVPFPGRIFIQYPGGTQRGGSCAINAGKRQLDSSYQQWCGHGLQATFVSLVHCCHIDYNGKRE